MLYQKIANMKHLVKKRYTVTRPRLLNMRNAQNVTTSRTDGEEKATGSAEKKLNFGKVSSTSLSNPIDYSIQSSSVGNQNYGLESNGYSSGTLTGNQIGSATGSYLNASSLISSFTSSNNVTHGTSFLSDPAKCDFRGLDTKLVAALRRMEQIQGRINTLETKFKHMNDTILTSISDTPIQLPEPAPVVKSWYKEITLDLREHLIRKLTNALFPMTPSTDDRIRVSLETCARKMEKDIFDKANSKSEYYHLLGERFYALNKHIGECQEKRKALQQNAN